jgi:S-adenosylmethionine synthetase
MMTLACHIDHADKFYNVTAMRMSASRIRKVQYIRGAYCYLVCRIGKPIQEPRLVDVQVRIKIAGEYH